MATGARAGARRGGPVGEKKSEGSYASSSPSYIQVASPAPPSPVLLCRFAFLLWENPLHITMFVLCYWQGTAAQQLARAVQTKWVRPPEWCAAGALLTCRWDARRAGRGAGAGAVIVYNPWPVTNPNPYYSTRVFPLSHARTHAHSLRTHARTVPRSRLSRILRAAHTLRQDRRFSFLLCCVLMRGAVLLRPYE